MLIDSHAHLDDKQFAGDRSEVLRRAKDMGLSAIVNVGYDLEASKRSVKLAEEHDLIFAAVGIHPHDAAEVPANVIEILKNLAESPKVVAIGEMGLDYYRNLSPRDVQQEMFRKQINLAKDLDLPIIVHDRDAHGDTMDILREYTGQVRGVLHCFSGSKEMAEECIQMGFYLSIAGPVTFKNANKVREVAANIPIDRLLVETDSPYLTPEPNRGKRNESGYVYYVAEKIAELKNMPVEELAQAAAENTMRLFDRIKI